MMTCTLDCSADARPRPAALALPPTFAATYSLLCLHVFMLLVRLRAEGNDGADLAQILYEGFQDDVELRVHAEGVKVSAPSHGSSCTSCLLITQVE